MNVSFGSKAVLKNAYFNTLHDINSSAERGGEYDTQVKPYVNVKSGWIDKKKGMGAIAVGDDAIILKAICDNVLQDKSDAEKLQLASKINRDFFKDAPVIDLKA